MDLLHKHNKYIKGTLPEAELESFTKEVVKDYFEEEALKQRWNEILKTEHDLELPTEESQAPQRSWIRRYLGPLSIAASVLFLVMAGLFYQKLMVPDYQKLLIAHLDDPRPENISRKGSIEELKLEAVERYNHQDYANAVTTFQKIAELDPAVEWRFYIGLCQLYQRKADLAIADFQEVLVAPKEYKVETHWYLSLAYLLKNDLVAAKKYLELVATHSTSEEAWKIKEAKALLQSIEKELNER